MVNNLDLTKYRQMKFVPTGMLFELPLLEALKAKRCPYCGNKLYEMRDKPFWWCKSRKHKRFVVSANKIK